MTARQKQGGCKQDDFDGKKSVSADTVSLLKAGKKSVSEDRRE